MTESFAEMFEESLANQELRRGAVVTGTVVDIQSDNVIVHAGLKSEGIIPIEQFKNAQGDLEVEVGDEVEVSLEAVEDGFGETRLSREKAKRDQVWRRLEEAFEKEEIVKGIISGKVKGGFTVDIDDIHWVIVGGESGPGARPVKAEWVRDIRDRCLELDVPFFFKQWGGVHKARAGRELDGRHQAPQLGSHRRVQPVGIDGGGWADLRPAAAAGSAHEGHDDGDDGDAAHVQGR